jgi:salicylate hydroxylase
MKILIAGAGIGGLTAALCLKQAGHQVQVFEQAPELIEAGAGLQCGANALRVMDFLGLLPQLEALAVAPQRVEFCDHKSGEVLYSTRLGDAYRKQYGAPYLHIHRGDLLKVLLAAYQSDTSAEIELNARVVSFREGERDVRLNLADGRTFSGDCLIAADGVKSVIRSQLLGDTPARFTGNVAWRGVITVERLPSDFMDTVVSNFVGPHKHMVIYYLRQQQLVNFVGVVESSEWREQSWLANAPWAELKADFEGWHPRVQQVIDAVHPKQCFRWALYHHLPFSNWSSARVTLLGDAAHATLPFMASGAAMAIEDARILQRALDHTDNTAQGFQLYQRNRLQRTTDIQTSSARLGKLYHISNRLALKLAFRALQPIGRAKERRLAEYDANTLELI